MREFHKQMDKRMFDFPKYYDEIAMRLPDGCIIAEVGVAEGASAIYLAEALLNLNKTFTFYLIDDLSYGQDRQLRVIMKNIGDANLGSFVEIVPLPSAEASCRFPDDHFDFVFIDASHKVEWTKADILLWYQKLKWEGVLAGHDYNDFEGHEVKLAVDTLIPRQVKVTENPKEHPGKQIIQTEQGHNIWQIRKIPQLKLRACSLAVSSPL